MTDPAKPKPLNELTPILNGGVPTDQEFHGLHDDPTVATDLTTQRRQFARGGALTEAIRDSFEDKIDTNKVLFAEGYLATEGLMDAVELPQHLRVAYGTGRITLPELIERLEANHETEGLREFSFRYANELVIGIKRKGAGGEDEWVKANLHVEMEEPDATDTTEDVRPRPVMAATFLNSELKGNTWRVISFFDGEVTMVDPRQESKNSVDNYETELKGVFAIMPKRSGKLEIAEELPPKA